MSKGKKVDSKSTCFQCGKGEEKNFHRIFNARGKTSDENIYTRLKKLGIELVYDPAVLIGLCNSCFGVIGRFEKAWKIKFCYIVE